MTTLYANVSFSETPFKTYTFLTDIKTLKKGDPLVVHTVHGFKIAEFVEYKAESVYGNIGKWVIQKVDLNKHNARTAQEKIDAETMLKDKQRKVIAAEIDLQARKLLTLQRKLKELE